MPELKVERGIQKDQVFVLRAPGPFLIGRDLNADFPLFDRRASRSHFRIDFRDEGYRLTDLNSKSGTFVNSQKVTTRVLLGGDQILAGKTLFSFQLDAPVDPLVGRELGPYRMLERVGRGGMGIVYRALQLSLDRVVALKVLSDDLTRDADFSALFISEARRAGELSHPNIVRVYDVNVLNEVLFYSMEYMAHGSVEDLLARHGVLPVHKAVEVAIQASRGLEYAEFEGVIHRDIKPANLMVSENGAVKIGDLGIATRSRERGGASSGQGISGSPHYMAPEQALGREVDHRADLYALGASLYQMLAGKTPFRGESLKELLFAHIREEPPDPRAARPEVPEALSALIRRLMAKDPAQRPGSASIVARELEKMLNQEALELKERRPDEAPWRRRVRWALSLLFFLLVGFGLGRLFSHLTEELALGNARIDRAREIIREGFAAIRSGDLETALKKEVELSKLEGSQAEWELLGKEISTFQKAVMAARAAKSGEKKK
jgi:serine/threonine protein kinase